MGTSFYEVEEIRKKLYSCQVDGCSGDIVKKENNYWICNKCKRIYADIKTKG